ncbi:MAG: hypothetical protein ABIQ10_06415 [Gemmatimonadaceae bacterium]
MIEARNDLPREATASSFFPLAPVTSMFTASSPFVTAEPPPSIRSIVICRPSVPRYMHSSPDTSATPSSVARYGGEPSTPTYTSASFAESSVHGSGVLLPVAFATALPSGLSLPSRPCESLALSVFLHEASAAAAAPSTARVTTVRTLTIDI